MHGLSAPQALHCTSPPSPNPESDLGSDEEYHGRSASEALQRSATEGRETVGRSAKAKPVRYKEFGEDEGVHSETSISEEDSDSEEDGSDSSDAPSSSLSSSLMEGEPSQPPSKRQRRVRGCGAGGCVGGVTWQAGCLPPGQSAYG